ncbi:unnamed protein product [Rotaria sordida]|uniref:Uncharacterized protein n=1 Tax=Rotaria sordida TaxID=392033 RepID=A0A814CH16_9BILA|nr:unnamed protein product [Rotaria sordida]CAF0940111.1 unnamed protein product [Rotaria sordida]CAF0940806.1 unnamed protein product [Rotaria sordida]
MSKIDVHNFHSYFRLKTNRSGILNWFNVFRIIHFLIYPICFYSGLWLPLLKLDLVETLALSFPAINGSSMNYTQYEKAYAKRCSLSPTISVDKIKGYIWMEGLNFYLCMCGMLLAFVAHICLYIFIGLVISILCNQLVSAFACRSIDILYDIRFTSIIIVQIVGFIVCLIFAFLLGIKYASLNLQLN